MMAVTTEAGVPAKQTILGQLLSFPALLGAVVATCVYLFVPRSMADPDIWWHLRDAQVQLSTRSFVTRDRYSYTTPGAPWINHEWIAELPFYLGWQTLGSRGLFLVSALAIECIFLGVFLLACRHAKNPKSALLATLVAAFLSTVSFGPRTLLFGWIGLVAELLLLDEFFRQSPATFRPIVWMLPLLFSIWVNTHGSWIIGMVVLLAFLVCGSVRISVASIEGRAWTREQLQTLSLATLLSTICLFINPYGWRLVAYPFNLAFHQRLNIANIEEWATLDFHSVRGHVLLVSLILVFFAQLLRPRRWAPYELAYVLIGAYAAFTYSRFLFLAAILIFPLIAKDLTCLPAYRQEKNHPRLNAAVLCMLVGGLVYHFPPRVEKPAIAGEAFPSSAQSFLDNFHPQGNVLNDYLWGGYLDWHDPQIPVFIDSRVDIFEYAGVLKDYLDATRLKDSLAILDKYSIRYVLFQSQAPLVYLLRHTPGWKVAYEDKSTVLLERMSSQGQARSNPRE